VGTRRIALLVVVCFVAAQAAGSAQVTNPRVLVFTKTTGHRHDSIPAAIQAVRDLGSRNGFTVTASEDATMFTATGLAPYAAVIFLLTSGEVLDTQQQAAFETYIRGGHGFVGVHSATDTERDWPWYGRFIGAWSSGHPEIQPAVIDVVTPRDGSTSMLPARWNRTDEWYGFLVNPRTNGVRVLLTIDESTYLPREFSMGADHPIAWLHEYEGGRAWYTQSGHTTESYAEPLFLEHLLGGIKYAIAGSPEAPPEKKPALVAPKFKSVTQAVRNGRLVLKVRTTGCLSCSAKFVVRSKTVPMRLAAGVLSGTSAVLPPGRWRLTITITDGTTKLRRTSRTFANIPRR
jgi:type 1 glutamine amidotransferase